MDQETKEKLIETLSHPIKRDKIIQIISHPRVEEINKETREERYKNYIWGLTESGDIYEWLDSVGEWEFVTLSPENV